MSTGWSVIVVPTEDLEGLVEFLDDNDVFDNVVDSLLDALDLTVETPEKGLLRKCLRSGVKGVPQTVLDICRDAGWAYVWRLRPDFTYGGYCRMDGETHLPSFYQEAHGDHHMLYYRPDIEMYVNSHDFHTTYDAVEALLAVGKSDHE